jgi:predicted lipoprotein with Yx(FWY)xxD motif
MNKFLINLLISASLVFSGTAYAATSTTNICTEKGDTVLAFFNGVSNTTQDADISL